MRGVHSRRLVPGILGIALVAALGGPGSASAQSLKDALLQTERQAASDSITAVPPAPWHVVAGEMLLGTALAAGAGYGVGLIAESMCDDCRAGDPGGGAAGMAIGVPAGAFLGVWLVGRAAPPSGRWTDTLMGALAGAAVFAGYAALLEEEGDAIRWFGAAAPGAVTAMAFNRSRRTHGLPIAAGGLQSSLQVSLVRLRF